MLTSMKNDGLRLVLFRDGRTARCSVYLWQGACLAGQPTAYCYRSGTLVWVVPGASVEFVEA